eukprot:15474308-Alexandrium_andersonii.AAC.1
MPRSASIPTGRGASARARQLAAAKYGKTKANAKHTGLQRNTPAHHGPCMASAAALPEGAARKASSGRCPVSTLAPQHAQVASRREPDTELAQRGLRRSTPRGICLPPSRGATPV